jgi:hypothetical protein
MALRPATNPKDAPIVLATACNTLGAGVPAAQLYREIPSCKGSK